MELTINQRRKIKQALSMLLAGIILGPLYVILADGIDNLYPFVNAVIVGVILAAIVATLELWVFTGSVRRMRFVTTFALRVFGYLFLISAVSFNVFLLSRMRRLNMTYMEVWESEEFANYIFSTDYFHVLLFALVIIALVNFTRQMSRKLGQGMLLAYISGRYRTPRREERIFMLIDLASSHLIAERLDGVEFHNFLNDLIYDMTEPIVDHGGIITQYVEAEVLVTWSMYKGLKNSNCIRAFFQIKEELAYLNEKYYEKYGFVPKIRAALHTGPVIRAEIGEVKTEVSFFGDTINTTSRILNECHILERGIIISDKLMQQVVLPEFYTYEKLGKSLLRGKTREVTLHTIKMAELGKEI